MQAAGERGHIGMPGEAVPLDFAKRDLRVRRIACHSCLRALLAALLVLVLFTPAQTFARGETYSGLLLPDALTPPIPVIVEFEQSQSRLSGQVKTSSPLTAIGRIVSGERQRSACSFKADIGAGRKLEFDGFCLSRTIEGTYRLVLPDGSSRSGTYRLVRGETDENRPKKARELRSEPARSATSCLAANSACLAACPREDYNAEFMCTNRCRQKLATCKASTATGAQSAATPGADKEP
jgi:hypothetical protein